ncbi:hypothetical protein FZEAL_3736 [Fusarium zealandicum]|uniref:HNH nuclease domain-containing protein n=1 Tax=Fusarium zealandicum TaxID=1053134 RepID=A0A8H4UNW1_9HYPO|nr:hypothetical protein FZEAL_3736 [Fusarium zealandicum]
MDNNIATAVPAYLTHYANEPKPRENLIDFVKARPEVQDVASLTPVAEYEMRLDAIMEIRRKHSESMGEPDFKLSVLQFYYLIRLLLSDLQRVAAQDDISAILLRHQLNDLINLTDYSNNTKVLQPSRLSQLTSGSRASLSQSERSKGRDDVEKDKCLGLDNNMCVVTGQPHPHVCHIVPFAWNKKASNKDTTTRFLPLMDLYLGLPREDATREALGLLTLDLGSSDRVWNMICLNPALYDWWRRGYFAFKYLGAAPSANAPETSLIKLQFVWMPRYIRQGTAKQPVNLDQQKEPTTRIEAALTHRHGEQSRLCSAELDCATCTQAKGVNTHHVLAHRPPRAPENISRPRPSPKKEAKPPRSGSSKIPIRTVAPTTQAAKKAAGRSRVTAQPRQKSENIPPRAGSSGA